MTLLVFVETNLWLLNLEITVYSFLNSIRLGPLINVGPETRSTLAHLRSKRFRFGLRSMTTLVKIPCPFISSLPPLLVRQGWVVSWRRNLWLLYKIVIRVWMTWPWFRRSRDANWGPCQSTTAFAWLSYQAQCCPFHLSLENRSKK